MPRRKSPMQRCCAQNRTIGTEISALLASLQSHSQSAIEVGIPGNRDDGSRSSRRRVQGRLGGFYCVRRRRSACIRAIVAA